MPMICIPARPGSTWITVRTDDKGIRIEDTFLSWEALECLRNFSSPVLITAEELAEYPGVDFVGEPDGEDKKT